MLTRIALWALDQQWIVDLIETIPWFARWVNRRLIGQLVGAGLPRPLPFSLWSPGDPGVVPAQAAVDAYCGAPYVSWTGLFDRSYSGRRIPPAASGYVGGLPSIARVAALFGRPPGGFVPCAKSSALFAFFAQWLTDSFMRTTNGDRRRNTSNHDIDLCQIYGLDAATAWLLRAHAGGRLRTRVVNRGEYPDRLFGPNNALYASLKYLAAPPGGVSDLDRGFIQSGATPALRASLYATGLERGSSSIFYAAISTIFIREHNRICRVLHTEYPNWNDGQLFETARLVLLFMALKLIVEGYINHISILKFQFKFDTTFAERLAWYRTNRIAIEFDLLYRWHALVPDAVVINGTSYAPGTYQYNMPLLEALGVEAVISAASAARAGRLQIGNTPAFLMAAETAALQMARNQHVPSYNVVRAAFGLDPIASFEALTRNAWLAAQLRALYGGDIDRVEYLVGLYAETFAPSSVMGPAMLAMVALDAFSHILTNPLLSANVLPRAIPAIGRAMIDQTNSLQDLFGRNTVANTPIVAQFSV